MKTLLFFLLIISTGISSFAQGDSLLCELEAIFTFEIVDDEVTFTNTSIGETDDATYFWSIDELTSTEENPTFSMADFEPSEFIYFRVENDSSCSSWTTDIIVIDTIDCDSILLDFIYEVIGDEIFFTSTSTGVPDDAVLVWIADPVYEWGYGDEWVFNTSEYEGEVEFRLKIDYYGCNDSVSTTIFFEEDSISCELEASFTYEIVDDEITFTNTSTGETDDATYYWEIDGLTSTAENPTFNTIDFEIYEEVCLMVYDSLEGCFDETCLVIYIEHYSSCSFSAGFTYGISDGSLYLANLSIDEPAATSYYWTVDGMSSTEENPTFSTVDFELIEEICFTVYDSLEDCSDEICTSVYFEPDTTDCGFEMDFTYTIADGLINFTNTSLGDPDDAYYNWNIDANYSSEENPSFPTADFEAVEWVRFTITDPDSYCRDSIGMMIYFEVDTLIEDSTDCEVIASFAYGQFEGNLYLSNTSTDEPDSPSYSWTVDGMSSSDENPIFPTADFETIEEVCFTVYDSLEDCSDEICITLYFPIDDGDSSDCGFEMDFTYTITDGMINFTNTSVDDPDDAYYSWSIDDNYSSVENPSFPTAGFEIAEWVCFRITDPDSYCRDSICRMIYFEEDVVMDVIEGFVDVAPIAADLASNDKFEINIYPNPANDILNITLKNLTNLQEIKLYNAIGELVHLETISDGTEKLIIDIDHLPSGLYIINIVDHENSERSVQRKLIKR